MRKSTKGQEIRVKGFLRAALRDVHTGKIQESPWYENVITAKGFENYIVGRIGGVAGSQPFSALGLGSTSAVNSTISGGADMGEFAARKAVTPTFVSAGTLQATASWDTNEATQSTINAIAVFGNTTASNGSCGSIATVTASTKTTNQTLEFGAIAA